MQFTYCTTWLQSRIMATGDEQWNNSSLFQSGKAGNRGINIKCGVTFHFLCIYSHRIKHPWTAASADFLVMIHNKKKWSEYQCWSGIKLGNRCSSTALKKIKNKNTLWEPNVHWSFCRFSLWNVSQAELSQPTANKHERRQMACFLTEL